MAALAAALERYDSVRDTGTLGVCATIAGDCSRVHRQGCALLQLAASAAFATKTTGFAVVEAVFRLLGAHFLFSCSSGFTLLTTIITVLILK